MDGNEKFAQYNISLYFFFTFRYISCERTSRLFLRVSKYEYQTINFIFSTRKKIILFHFFLNICSSKGKKDIYTIERNMI